jgi:hypothetical protein
MRLKFNQTAMYIHVGIPNHILEISIMISAVFKLYDRIIIYNSHYALEISVSTTCLTAYVPSQAEM